MDATLDARCADLVRASERLKLHDAHDALALLRASFSTPKLFHVLRTAPCAGHPSLQSFDLLLREALCHLLNTLLTDTQWIQASMPVSYGGLGLRRVASLAPSAFLASAASTRLLQDSILAKSGILADDSKDRALALWSSTSGHPGVVGPDAIKQRSWDTPCLSVEKDKIWSSSSDGLHCA